MAYSFGQANDLPSLMSALLTACANGGWTVNGQIASKGDCFVKLAVVGAFIEATAGLGVAGTTLTTPTPTPVRLQAVTSVQLLDWPVAYYAHVFDTEVYFIVRYGVDRYTYLAFGQSPVPGLPGKGVWITGFPPTNPQGLITYNNNPPYGGRLQDYNGFVSTGPFWIDSPSSNTNTYVHYGLDGNVWSAATTSGRIVAGNWIAGYQFAAQPNKWNGEAVLLPIQPIVDRPSNKTSMVLDLANARYLRINNLDPEQVIAMGSDRWKVYPFYRKNAAAPNGGSGSGADHSGTFGWAMRYDGA